jgi:hypothetical protein
MIVPVKANAISLFVDLSPSADFVCLGVDVYLLLDSFIIGLTDHTPENEVQS